MVDTLASGASGRKPVEVQVLSSAPIDDGLPRGAHLISVLRMTSLSLRPLIILMLVLTILAGSAVAQSTGEDARAEQDTAQQASMSETQRQDVLLRKMILMGFPAAAVGGLIIALVVTRKKGRERRQQAQQNRN